MHPWREVSFAIDRSRVEPQNRGDEGGERRSRVLVPRPVSCKVAGPERAVARQGLTEEPEQAESVGSGVKAV